MPLPVTGNPHQPAWVLGDTRQQLAEGFLLLHKIKRNIQLLLQRILRGP